LQDIHVALRRSFARFDGRCSLRTWAYRVAYNTAASHVDRERRARRDIFDIDAAGELPGTDSLARQLEERGGMDRPNAWNRRLKPPDRQLLTLYLEDLDAGAIAEITGLTPGAVATRISRLKTQLAKDFEETHHV